MSTLKYEDFLGEYSPADNVVGTLVITKGGGVTRYVLGIRGMLYSISCCMAALSLELIASRPLKSWISLARIRPASLTRSVHATGIRLEACNTTYRGSQPDLRATHFCDFVSLWIWPPIAHNRPIDHCTRSFKQT